MFISSLNFTFHFGIDDSSVNSLHALLNLQADVIVMLCMGGNLDVEFFCKALDIHKATHLVDIIPFPGRRVFIRIPAYLLF